MKLFLSGVIAGAGAVLLIVACVNRSSKPSTDPSIPHPTVSSKKVIQEPSGGAAASHSDSLPFAPSPDVITETTGAEVSVTDSPEAKLQIYVIEAPQTQSEVAAVLTQLTSARDEKDRRYAMSRLHNYLVDHPDDLSVRLAIRNAAAFDVAERVRKHGVGFLALSSNEDDFAHALTRMALDPSPEVQLCAIEKVAKVSEENYWIWLLKHSGREKAKTQHEGRKVLAAKALRALSLNSPLESIKAAAMDAARQFDR